jgi:thiamine biosynthesis lipoprotein
MLDLDNEISYRLDRTAVSTPLRPRRSAAPQRDSLARYEASHAAMGTIFSIVVYGDGASMLAGAVDAAFREIDRLDSLMSVFKPASELCKINREASRQSVVVTPELFRLLQKCLRYSQDTGGAFDVTVGPLMKLWGFFQKSCRMPAKEELAQTLKRVGYRHVRLDARERTVAFDCPGIEFDLGAAGKGYAVDRAVAMLRAAGVKRALISSGTSSIYALGAPPGEQGWQISVCHPLERRNEACSLRLRDLSISFSGGYEQCFVLNGKMYTHLLDPRTGTPVEQMLMTAVLAESNTASDALSTAFFAAGVEQAKVYLRHHSNLAAIFYWPGASAHSVEQTMLKSRVVKLAAQRWVMT